MEDQLNLIITQNWVMLALLGFIWICSLICNFYTFKDRKAAKSIKNDELGLSELWEKDLLDELLEKSKIIRYEYPNRVDAIYFRAKALRKRGLDNEALELWETLKKVDPSFTDESDKQINDINVRNATNKQNQADA